MSTTKQTKHTPGPWETVAGPGETDFAVCMEGGGDVIAEIYTKNIADRDLIAAAPELLAACRTLLDAYNEQVTPTHMEWRAIEAAIAKAEGR